MLTNSPTDVDYQTRRKERISQKPQLEFITSLGVVKKKRNICKKKICCYSDASNVLTE